MNTPILVDYYAHPIEKASAKLFVEKLGCGVSVYKTRKICKVVDHLIQHPEELKQYQLNTQKIDKHKNGSAQIAEIIIEEVKKTGKYNEEL